MWLILKDWRFKLEEIIDQTEKQLSEILALVADDLKGVKTGRAKPSLIEDVKIYVESYGSSLTLKELASITAPDPHSLIISPWDKTILKAIEKEIAAANLNLAPVIDNDIIRVKIPPLTEETRKELVKLVWQKIESGKKMMRQARNEAKSAIEEAKDKPGVSEDDIRRWLDQLQEKVDQYMEKITVLGQTKEKELMTV